MMSRPVFPVCPSELRDWSVRQVMSGFCALALVPALANAQPQPARSQPSAAQTAAVKAVVPQPTPEIGAALSSTNPVDQMLALERVSELGPSAVRFVPQIIPLLKSPDLGIQHEALLALGAIGPEAKAAMPALLPLLASDQILLKYQTLVALRGLHADSKAVGPAIAKLLGDEDSMVRIEAAADVLVLDLPETDRAVTVLTDALKSRSPAVQRAAVPWLARAGTAALPALKDALGSDQPGIQLAAIDALGMQRETAEPVVPELLKLSKSDQVPVLVSLARTLGAIGSSGDNVVKTLTTLSQSESVAVRISALQALVTVGGSTPEVLKLLEAALRDGDIMVRLTACDALGTIGSNAKPAIAALVEAVQDGEGSLSVRAAEALGRIGAPAVPALESLVKDGQYSLLALQTLESMGPIARPATKTLVEVLGKPGPVPARHLCLTLAGIGADPKVAGPALLKVLKDPSSDARAAAAYALGRIGDRSAIKELTNVIEDENPMVRLGSAWALLHLEPHNDDYIAIALPRLIEALDRPEPMIRLEAARTLSQLGQDAAPAVPALVKCLGHDDSRPVRIATAMTLAELGPAAVTAVPALTGLAQDSNTEGRRAAMFALGKLGTIAKASAPVLERAITTGGPEDGIVAAWALLQIEPDDRQLDLALPVLLEAIGKERPEVVVAVVRAASNVGARRPKIREAIEPLLKANDPALRAAAAAALERITAGS